MTAVTMGQHVYYTEDHKPTDWWLIGAAVLVIANAVDIILTRYLLTIGAVEQNFLLAPIVTGPWAPVIKTFVPGFVGWGYVNGPRTPAMRRGLRLAVLLYALVCAWNTRWLLVH